jgi:riboflavin biosynthesis pyrimidine reductase
MLAPSPSSAFDPCGVRPLITIDDRSAAFPLIAIFNAWSRRYYDGPFHLFPAPPDVPAISLVFVQSRGGNTVVDNPAELGGGPTDKYLIYEGLSRVAADGVMAGAGTAGKSVFFSVTHPELVSLRRDLGLPQHPAQIVVSDTGRVNFDARLFTSPDARVFVLAGKDCIRKCGAGFRERPWITMIPIETDLTTALLTLRREHGIGRISCIGGRTLATALVDAHLVQDIYLTTSAIEAGEPCTPWYAGDTPPGLDLIVRKREERAGRPILFEHFAITPARGPGRVHGEVANH